MQTSSHVYAAAGHLEIGSKCFVEGLGWGVIHELIVGKRGWSCRWYYRVKLNRHSFPHIFAHDELVSHRCGVANPM
jgi:hypothetical protein